MKKDTWVKKIKKACEEAGTYRPYFDYAITTLAEILEKRDDAAKAYVDYIEHKQDQSGEKSRHYPVG